MWVFDKNNAWAVGEIYFNDSTGRPDMVHLYNAAHWNGSKWEIIKVQFYTFCNQTSTNAYPANCIWGFSPSNIYIASGSQIAKVNGTTQTDIACLPVSVNKIWGINNNNLFTVGPLGQIGFYNGNNWIKMTSNTTCDLQDIWGIDATHIWATGFNNSDGHSVILQFNGASWSTTYDNANKSENQIQYFNTVWTDNINYIYLDGGSYTNILTLNTGIFHRTDSLSTNEVFCLRGTKGDDIFRVGYGGETVHYNGSTWHLYNELKTLNNGTAWFNCVYPSQNMILIGGWYPTALNGFPVVIRGYR